MTFPAPIGGVPFKSDFAPSIAFACAYAILCIVAIFRLSKRTTRTLVVLSPLAFSLERSVFAHISPLFYLYIYPYSELSFGLSELIKRIHRRKRQTAT